MELVESVNDDKLSAVWMAPVSRFRHIKVNRTLAKLGLTVFVYGRKFIGRS